MLQYSFQINVVLNNQPWYVYGRIQEMLYEDVCYW